MCAFSTAEGSPRGPRRFAVTDVATDSPTPEASRFRLRNAVHHWTRRSEPRRAARPTKEVTLFHRRMSLVVVLLAFAGCSTNPATGITSHSAYLNGEGNCPAAGQSFTWYYNLWDSQGNVQNGPQYYANCSGQSSLQALPSIQFGNLLTGADHCFAIHVWYHTPWQEFMHFDSVGTKNGYSFDCFKTQYVPPPDVMQAAPYPEAGAAGPPSSVMYSTT